MNAPAAVLYERREAVALVTLNRPDSLNAFNQAMRLELVAALERAGSEQAAAVVVLAAAGRAFSSGADLKSMRPEDVNGAEVRRQLDDEYGAGLRAIITMDKPVVVAVEGLVAGIGCAYMLACDLAVMAEDAYFTLPFHNIGLIPDGGINWLLERQLGARRAFELAVECERVPAKRCHELGLVNRVVPHGEATTTALQWAARLAQRAPLALMHTKRMLRNAAALDFDRFRATEAAAQAECADSADFREGVAAFLQKRAPRFGGR